MKERILILAGLVGYTAFIVILIAIFFSNLAQADTSNQFRYGEIVKLKNSINMSPEARFYNCDKVKLFTVAKYFPGGAKYEIKPDVFGRDQSKFAEDCFNHAEVVMPSTDLDKVN